MRPVAIQIDSPAGGRLVGTRERRLTVLAPQAVVCLRVNEAVWVDDRQEVEVVVVDEGGHVLVLAVAGDELVGEVFDCHGGDPFTSVDGS